VNQESGDRIQKLHASLDVAVAIQQLLTPPKTSKPPSARFFQIFTRAFRLVLPLLTSPTTSGPAEQEFFSSLHARARPHGAPDS
jgi:hypothetical protein